MAARRVLWPSIRSFSTRCQAFAESTSKPTILTLRQPSAATDASELSSQATDANTTSAQDTTPVNDSLESSSAPKAASKKIPIEEREVPEGYRLKEWKPPRPKVQDEITTPSDPTKVQLRRKGGKNVYLPNFIVTLVRTPRLPLTYAQFIVPLNLNKLDMRNYLFHVYGLQCKSIRSFVQYVKVVNKRTENAQLPDYKRPRAIKKMMVEMDKPFVWPAEPTDLTPWDKELYDKQDAYRTEQMEARLPNSGRDEPTKAIERAKQAERELMKTQREETRGKDSASTFRERELPNVKIEDVYAQRPKGKKRRDD